MRAALRSFAWVSLFSVACNPEKEPNDTQEEGGSDGSTEPTPMAFDAPEELIGVANIDDDDLDGVVDWDGLTGGSDDDLVTFTLPASVVDGRVEGEVITLEIEGELAALRVWAGGTLLLDEVTPGAELPADLTGDVVIGVEYGGFRNAGLLRLQQLAPDGSSLATVEIPLESAPLILNHHLQGGERAMAIDVSGGMWGNDAYLEMFESVIGDAFFTGAGREYGGDVWAQDELEFATLTAPGGKRMDVVIDSIRSGSDRFLDSFPENELAAPGTAVHTWGDGRVTSQDSFGNLEISPPVTVDGVHYPFGRVYYGNAGGALQVTQELRDFLASQAVQAPFELDVSFLCVGHVDEIATTLPDPSAPQGFRLLFADTRAGWEVLEGLPPEHELPLYSEWHDADDISELTGNGRLRAYNEEVQDILDYDLEILRTELGLAEEQIVLVPALFEESAACGGFGLSLIPGTVNMEVWTHPDGSGAEVLIPDPFFRARTAPIEEDPLIPIFESLLPASVTPHWTDDWFTYHLGWGEVHCGSNTQRTPAGEWWNDARHLLGGAE
jgi:protein-arginine deiminase